MKTRKSTEDLIKMGQLTGQWNIRAAAYLLNISETKIMRLIKDGEILVTLNHDSKGNVKAKGRHIRTEHLRDYIRHQYGNVKLLQSLNP